MINYWTRLEPTSEFFMFAAPHKWFSIPSPPTPWSAHTHTHRAPLVLVGNKKDLHMQRYSTMHMWCEFELASIWGNRLLPPCSEW